MRVRNLRKGRPPLPRGRALSSRAGFSLVEMAVVTVIIGVLVALLSGPMISKAKRAANATRCINNLRQIALATQLYASDHSGMLPDGAGGYKDNATANIMRFQLIDYVPRQEGKDVWFCPAQPRPISFYYYPNLPTIGMRLPTLAFPERVILWRDRGYDPALGGDTAASPREPGPHDGSYIACFADGHAEALPDKSSLMDLLREYPGTGN